MTATSLVSSGGSNLDLYSYTYNVGNQRTAVERGGENTAAYTYDAIGQVIADQATEVSGGTTRLNEQLRYGFDPAGNLNYRTNNALVGNFQVNTLNELTANTNGGTLTVMGTTTSPATTVAVNGTNAAHYNDATFAATNMPLTTTYTATASDSLGRSATNTVTVSIAPSTTFQYDGNGNLTNDGLRNFAYDDENQLIQVWVTNQFFSQFTYDGKMRRRIRQEYAWQGGAWVQTNEVYYVYDGNEVIQERDLNNLPTTTYTRGKDLSGSLEGAGGIGGLLSMTLNSALGTSSSNSMVYHADGNGNITMLINSSQSIVAKYLYDAFGNILSKSGLLADANLYRFSSKESHQNSGLVYYLYRYYDPNLQRWPNRDPIGESGFEVMRHTATGNVGSVRLSVGAEPITGPNLYVFIGNKQINFTDPLGLDYGNPVSGPNGPVGPSSPYAPGGPYYPNGYLYSFYDPVQACTERCLAASGAGYALGALGLASGTVGTIPKPGGSGALGAGGLTTGLSIGQQLTGLPLRNLGRQLNPFGTAVQCLAAGYLAGLQATCSAMCSSNPNSF